MHHLENTVRYRLRRAWVNGLMLKNPQERQRFAETKQRADELLAAGQKESMLATIEDLLNASPQAFITLKNKLPKSYADWSVGDFIDMKNALVNPNM